MADIVELEDWLKQNTQEFETRKKLFVFSELIYKPTGEKVVTGFRYFACEASELLAAFEAGDIAAIQRLNFALDDDGDPDTSSVCLLVAYTASGAFLAAQPQQYQDYVPTLLREPRMLGNGSLGGVPLALDQSA